MKRRSNFLLIFYFEVANVNIINLLNMSKRKDIGQAGDGMEFYGIPSHSTQPINRITLPLNFPFRIILRWQSYLKLKIKSETIITNNAVRH